MFGHRSRDQNFWKGKVRYLLRKRRCLVCLEMREGLDRYFFWFIEEQYRNEATREALCQSYGFCPIHTHHLLMRKASWCCQAVFRDVIEQAVARLRKARAALSGSDRRNGPNRRCAAAAKLLAPQEACPACTHLTWCQRLAIHALLATLSDPEVREEYVRSSGLCLPHFQLAALRADWDTLSVMTAHLQTVLSSLGDPEKNAGAWLEAWAGLDIDEQIRSRPLGGELARVSGAEKRQLSESDRSQAADEPSPGSLPPDTPDLLDEQACPACTACERGLLTYLRWLAGEMDTRRSRSDLWDPAWELCPRHLWDAYAAGYRRAAALAAEAGNTWLSQLEALTADLATRPPDRFLERLALLPSAWSIALRDEPATEGQPKPARLWQATTRTLESPGTRLARIRARRFRPRFCEACTHVSVTIQRTIDLLGRVLENPVGKRACQNRWGLCLRHCLVAARLVDLPEVLAELLSLQIARLGPLDWELQEAARKTSWSVRYEPKGSEFQAWQRAAHRLAGTSLQNATVLGSCLADIWPGSRRNPDVP